MTLVFKPKKNRTFKTFLVQAIGKDGSPIGEFAFNDAQNAKCLKCGENLCGSITHSNSGYPIKRVIATWGSPTDINGIGYVGPVQFRISVASSFNEYWVDVDGPKLTISK